MTPAQIVASAIEEGVHLVGLSILSGSHLELVPGIVAGLRAAGAKDLPVVVGGIIPDADAKRLVDAGVTRVYTPKDFELNAIMRDLVRIIRENHHARRDRRLTSMRSRRGSSRASAPPSPKR